MKPRIFFQGPPLEFIGIELIYFIAIVAMSMYIYFKSREIYNLTKHKGVDYFSNIFLFFSLAYLLRLWNVFSSTSEMMLGINLWEKTFYLDFLLLGYFSTMAVIYLILTSLHRCMEKKFEPPEALIHAGAIVFSVVIFVTKSYEIMLLLQILLMLVSTVFLLRSSKGKTTFTMNRISLLLLFAFWAISAIVIMVMLPFIVKIFLYLVSAAVFTSFFLRVRRRLS
ncbi:MAG: hypothetical protein ABII71_02990 [Candidatus Micrarchaeota archaeon]